MKPKPLQFRISSALKTIIGKELITDDYIAVFELVKNAFDAHATRVDVIFKGLTSDNPTLVVKDNGKGMSYDDLVAKWLFVAYSAKKDGTEDTPAHDGDYRHKIHSNRVFAGAKGIGRFSCDRLGGFLTVYTTPDAQSDRIHKLDIDWEDFEQDDKKEFVRVSVDYSRISVAPYKLKHGTVLEISGFRTNWNREALLRLKHSLEKLINPNQENDTTHFAVHLRAEDEIEADKDEHDPRQRVNGPISNFLFEDLGLKTTRIVTRIADDGATVTTELVDRDRLIYRLVEKNPFPFLKSVAIHLFHLNRSAKLHFTKKMGVHSLQYGSVFLYKNGFRIYPFGESGEVDDVVGDVLGLDRRKQQGWARFLGTRDVMGRIEIQDSEHVFKETSSRDGGLIKDEAFGQLRECFYDYALRRLEKYVVDVIKWGDPVKELNGHTLSPAEVRDEIFDLISRLTNSEDVVDLKYDPEILDLVKNRSEQSVSGLLKNFTRIADTTGDVDLAKEVKKARRQLTSLATAKAEAEKEVQAERLAGRKSQRELEAERKKNLFLLATSRDASPDTQGLVHAIKIASTGVEAVVRDLARAVKTDEYNKDEFLKGLQDIRVHAQKILNISRIVTRANFTLEVQRRRGDLARYVYEYLCDAETPHGGIDIQVTSKQKEFQVVFSPIEVSIVLDNIVSNAGKARARNMLFEIIAYPDKLVVRASDDGLGVEPSVEDTMFELGTSTRNGSGIGLYTCRDLMGKMKGAIRFVGNGAVLTGATFELEFNL